MSGAIGAGAHPWRTLAVLVALVVVAVGFAGRRTRPAVTALVLGVIVGISVPFLPIVMNLGIPADQFYRLIWFRSWI